MATKAMHPHLADAHVSTHRLTTDETEVPDQSTDRRIICLPIPIEFPLATGIQTTPRMLLIVPHWRKQVKRERRNSRLLQILFRKTVAVTVFEDLREG